MVDKKTTKTSSTAEPTQPISAPVVVAPHQAPAGLAIAALVTGIVAFVFGWVPFFDYAAGITAIILGIIALKKHAGVRGMSIAGIILGCVATLWSIVVSIFLVIGLVALGTTGAVYGDAINQANQALGQYTAENKALVDAKKDFNKGDTATFGHFEVKVTNVQRNYVPSDSHSTPATGNEFIVVTVNVKNVGTQSETISNYDFKMNDNGAADMTSYITVDPAFTGGELPVSASASGTIVYEITKDSNNLKLQYNTYAYDLNAGIKNLVFTLAI